MKKITFPTPYTILFVVIFLAAALTYVLPSGKYDTLLYDKQRDLFVIQSIDTTYTVEAT